MNEITSNYNLKYLFPMDAPPIYKSLNSRTIIQITEYYWWMFVMGIFIGVLCVGLIIITRICFKNRPLFVKHDQNDRILNQV